MTDCDDCERLPLNEYSIWDLISELAEWIKDLNLYHITALEEITREWRETH